MKMIEVTDLTFSYSAAPERRVLDNMSFDVEQGTITALAGPSGCGKSTVCRILTGMLPADEGDVLEGKVYIDGEETAGRSPVELSETVGFVMQDPDRQIVASTVEDELAFGPENLCVEPAEIRRRVDETMKLLGIEGMACTDPAKISGGQKQLVAIGAVLTMEPRLLIMDEPFSHIDDEGKKALAEILKKLRSAGRTILIVDHDYLALDFADRILWMEEGKIHEHQG